MITSAFLLMYRKYELWLAVYSLFKYLFVGSKLEQGYLLFQAYIDMYEKYNGETERYRNIDL